MLARKCRNTVGCCTGAAGWPCTGGTQAQSGHVRRPCRTSIPWLNRRCCQELCQGWPSGLQHGMVVWVCVGGAGTACKQALRWQQAWASMTRAEAEAAGPSLGERHAYLVEEAKGAAQAARVAQQAVLHVPLRHASSKGARGHGSGHASGHEQRRHARSCHPATPRRTMVNAVTLPSGANWRLALWGGWSTNVPGSQGAHAGGDWEGERSSARTG